MKSLLASILTLLLAFTTICNAKEKPKKDAPPTQLKGTAAKTLTADELLARLVGKWERTQNGSQLSFDDKSNITWRLDNFGGNRYSYPVGAPGERTFRIEKDPKTGLWYLYEKERYAGGESREQALLAIVTIADDSFDARYITRSKPVDWTATWKRLSKEPEPFKSFEERKKEQ